MLKALKEAPGLSVVTKAKSNAKAFFPPGKYKGRGARPKRGPCVKVASFFTTHAELFNLVEMTLYGKKEAVRYFCIDLLWGEGVYQNLRFVLTVIDGTRSIFVSTDLTLSPKQVVSLYCRRFKIECAFRELKQVVAGFAYHFWSKAMPKLQKFKCNDTNRLSLEQVEDKRSRELIGSTVNAIECFVQVSVVALGMLQLVSLLFWKEINLGGMRFMRTRSSSVPSERTTADYLRKNIFALFRFFPKMTLTTIIYDSQTHRFDPVHGQTDTHAA
jgi:hypothetical protein